MLRDAPNVTILAETQQQQQQHTPSVNNTTNNDKASDAKNHERNDADADEGDILVAVSGTVKHMDRAKILASSWYVICELIYLFMFLV